MNDIITGGMSTSPVPVAPAAEVEKMFDFGEAMQRVGKGERVTRKEWGNDQVFGLLRAGRLHIKMDDAKFHLWSVSDGDINADDWYSLDEKVK